MKSNSSSTFSNSLILTSIISNIYIIIYIYIHTCNHTHPHTASSTLRLLAVLFHVWLFFIVALACSFLWLFYLKIFYTQLFLILYIIRIPKVCKSLHLNIFIFGCELVLGLFSRYFWWFLHPRGSVCVWGQGHCILQRV